MEAPSEKQAAPKKHSYASMMTGDELDEEYGNDTAGQPKGRRGGKSWWVQLVCMIHADGHQQQKRSANRQGPDWQQWLAWQQQRKQRAGRGVVSASAIRPPMTLPPMMLAACLQSALSKSVGINLHLTCGPGSCTGLENQPCHLCQP